MDHESLAAANSRRALSLWSKNQGTVFIWGGLQVLEGSSVEGCRSGPSISTPKGSVVMWCLEHIDLLDHHHAGMSTHNFIY